MSLNKYQISSLSYKFPRIPHKILFKIFANKLSLQQICKLKALEKLKINEQELTAHWLHCEREWSWAQQNKIQLIFWDDCNYPKSLCNLSRPPLFLFIKGAFDNCLENNVAIVGSRNPSSLTKSWVDEHIPGFINDANCTVVSGGARGIDQMAHFAAIRLNKPSLCFLPSGLYKPYPSEWSQLQDDLLSAGGCFISPFPLFQNIYKYHFYWRNEMMVAMSKMVFVAEASLRSGSMMTARHCLEQGKELVTLPSHPGLNHAHGNIQLIADGVPFVRNQQELLAHWMSLSSSLA